MNKFFIQHTNTNYSSDRYDQPVSARLLSGLEVADHLLESLKPMVKKLNPQLVVIQVGENEASASYIKQKIKSCDAVGMRHEHHHLPEKTTQETFFVEIEKVDNDDDVTGFFIQLQLPSHLLQ